MRDAYEPTADDVRGDAPDGPEGLFGFNPYGPAPARPRTMPDQAAPQADNCERRRGS